MVNVVVTLLLLVSGRNAKKMEEVRKAGPFVATKYFFALLRNGLAFTDSEV
jgi:hypothetical protein